MIGKGLRFLRFFLLGEDSQLLHLTQHLLLLADIAAKLVRLGAGQPNAAPLQDAFCTALCLMGFTAQAAGHPQAELHAVGFRPQGAFFARTFHMCRSGGQGKFTAPRHYRLAALGTYITKTACFLHHTHLLS